MPKQKITKDMVVAAAFELVRAGGPEQVLVKNIAEKLGCSVQPIYSYCSNMEGLKKDVNDMISDYFRKYVAEHVDKDDMFASTGKLYLRLSKEEPNLFQMYFMGKRPDYNVHSLDELYDKEGSPMVVGYIAKKYGLSHESARKLHLNMIIYNQGIASMNIATGLQIPLEELEQQLEQAFSAFLQKAREEES